MNKNKINTLVFSLATLLIAANVFSIPKGPCSKKNDVCCEEPAPGPFAFSYPKDIGLSCQENFYAGVEFLYMQVKEDGLEYAMTQENTPTNAFPITDGEIKGHSTGSRSWDWTMGVRIGLGFYINDDRWAVDAKWTYLRINNDTGTTVSSGVLLPLFMTPEVIVNQPNNVDSSMRWTGDINALDLRISKPYHISRYVVFNPHFGIRVAWIERDLLVRNGGEFTIGSDTGAYIDVFGKNDFWGVGPRFGLESNWHLGAGWYLFGNFAASLLYSHFDVEQSMAFADHTHYQIEHDFYTNSANMDISLGICWSYMFSKDKYMVSLKAAYEMQQWWDQNRFRRFFSTSSPIGNDELSRSDLKINGFSFAIAVDF